MKESADQGLPSLAYASSAQIFETDHFIIVALAGYDVRNLLGVLLQDELLGERIDWMTDKSRDGALQEAFGMELLCNAGQALVWSIVDRARRMQIGAVIARHSLGGLDVEVLVASQFWDRDVSEEVVPPIVEWLHENVTEANLVLQ